MSTPIAPIMDNLYLDTYYFKCSKFWYWEHFRAMLGENKLGAWAQEIEYTEPKIKTTAENTYTIDDCAVYMGMRPNTKNLIYSKLAVNAYIDIWNNWFRDQNLQAPIEFDTTDADLTVDGTINTGCGLLPVAKFHDYFTSALPEPQKGSSVTTPLGTTAPVMFNSDSKVNTNTLSDINIYRADGTKYTSTDGDPIAVAANGQIAKYGGSISGASAVYVSAQADLTQATAATINALRLAFATQRILEKDARFGTRYREILKGHFGVTASDESLLVPEYLGGKRIPLNIV